MYKFTKRFYFLNFTICSYIFNITLILLFSLTFLVNFFEFFFFYLQHFFHSSINFFQPLCFFSGHGAARAWPGYSYVNISENALNITNLFLSFSNLQIVLKFSIFFKFTRSRRMFSNFSFSFFFHSLWLFPTLPDHNLTLFKSVIFS